MDGISVLVKYEDEINKASSGFSYGRDLFKKWSAFKITYFAIIMSKLDWYTYLVEVGFINNLNVNCKQCNGKMQLQDAKCKVDGVRWVCKNTIDIGSVLCTRKCTGTRSVRFNSWFYKSKLRIVEVLLFTYFWWFKIPLNQIKREYGFADHTLVDWASFCREVAIDIVFNHSESIGGIGVIVEIDESKFGKSK